MDWLFLVLGIAMVIVKVNHFLVIPDFLIWICFGVFVVCFIRGLILEHKVSKRF